jgi:hypothetical protein
MVEPMEVEAKAVVSRAAVAMVAAMEAGRGSGEGGGLAEATVAVRVEAAKVKVAMAAVSRAGLGRAHRHRRGRAFDLLLRLIIGYFARQAQSPEGGRRRRLRLRLAGRGANRIAGARLGDHARCARRRLRLLGSLLRSGLLGGELLLRHLLAPRVLPVR